MSEPAKPSSTPTPAQTASIIATATLTEKMNIFTAFVHLVKTETKAVLLTLVIIAASALFYKGYTNIDRILVNAYPEHNFQRNLKADTQIQGALSALRNATDADRVTVAQWHNGTKGDGRLPFRSYSVQYADVAPGVSYTPSDFTSVPLSTIAEINEEMWPSKGTPICIERGIDDLRSEILRQRWQRRGTKYAYSCPIVALDGTPVGAVSAEYMDSSVRISPLNERIREELASKADKIAGYLQSVHDIR